MVAESEFWIHNDCGKRRTFAPSNQNRTNDMKQILLAMLMAMTTMTACGQKTYRVKMTFEKNGTTQMLT